MKKLVLGFGVLAALCAAAWWFRETWSHQGIAGSVGVVAGNSSASPAPEPQRISYPSSAPSKLELSSLSLERFLDLKARAENGDLTAQFELSELYGLCQPVNLDPVKFVGNYEVIAKQTKDSLNAAAMIGVAKKTVTICSAVDGGALVPREASALWRKAAASGGQVSALAKQYILSAPGEKPKGAEFKGFMDQVIASSDPRAVFELGQLVAGSQSVGDVGPYGAVAADPISGYAWSIVGCRMGLNCETDSFVMDTLCLNTGACTNFSFEEFIRTSLVPSSDQAVLDSKIIIISEFFKQK